MANLTEKLNHELMRQGTARRKMLALVLLSHVLITLRKLPNNTSLSAVYSSALEAHNLVLYTACIGHITVPLILKECNDG
jgi:hypothetical protein